MTCRLNVLLLLLIHSAITFFNQLQGDNFTRGCQFTDYKIHVGSGDCKIDRLTNNEIDCKPPDDKPNKGNSSLCQKDEYSVEVFNTSKLIIKTMFRPIPRRCTIFESLL